VETLRVHGLSRRLQQNRVIRPPRKGYLPSCLWNTPVDLRGQRAPISPCGSLLFAGLNSLADRRPDVLRSRLGHCRCGTSDPQTPPQNRRSPASIRAASAPIGPHRPAPAGSRKKRFPPHIPATARYPQFASRCGLSSPTQRWLAWHPQTDTTALVKTFAFSADKPVFGYFRPVWAL